MAEVHSTQLDPLDVARFWSKVEVGRVGECWPWRAGVTGDGYGIFVAADGTKPAHRVAFALTTGEWPPVVRHRCDRPGCCNPLHLLSGTHADNVRDRVVRKRSAVGEGNGRALLTEAQAREIAADRSSTARALADRHGVTVHTVRAIRRKRIWRHL